MNVLTGFRGMAAFLGTCATVGIIFVGPARASAAPKPCDAVARTSGDQDVQYPGTVQLNAQPSQDADTFSWMQAASDPYQVTLDDPTVAKPRFALPNVPRSGADLHFTVTVNGCAGADTDSTTVTVHVTNPNANQRPSAVVAVTPVEALVGESQPFTLDGTGSSDPDNDELSFVWEQEVSAGVWQPVSRDARVTLTAPASVPYPNGTSLTFRLTVSDGSLSASAQQIVNVSWVNDPPVVSIYCTPAEVNEGGDVLLDSDATDDDGDGIASYDWAQIEGGPDAGLTAAMLSLPGFSFDAPSLTSPFDLMTFRLTVKDNGGLKTAKECSVRVLDVTSPVVVVRDLLAEATSAAGAVVHFSVTANDAKDGPLDATCSQASGDTFPLGVTPVTCSATDAAGNTGSATFNVTVVDTTPPDLSLPSDISKEATSAAGAVVTFSAAASDIVDGAVTPSCSPASGSTFALGSNTVNCTATDKAGNTGSGSFTVTVVDTTPPKLTLPASTKVEATGPTGAEAPFNATASDIVDGAVTPVCTPASGSTFALGSTTVNCTATDKAGNEASGSFTVTVVDTTPPDLTVPADMQVPATAVSGAAVTFAVSATDLVDGSVTPVCKVSGNTVASGSTFAPGANVVTCTATDAHGNSASVSFTITVQFTFSGFFQPVDNFETGVVNTVKAGSTVPLKFRVQGAGGVMIGDTAVVDLAKTGGFEVPCSAELAPESLIDLTATGGTSLRYDATAQQFIYNWQTPKPGGRCYWVVVTLKDGSVKNAKFKLK